MFEDIKKIKSGSKELREFGLTIGLILVILGSALFWRERPFYPYFLGAGSALACFGLLLPNLLRPLQKSWMTVAIIIGFFVSRLILWAIFYFVITPIGVTMRILGKDVLNERIDESVGSYWMDKEHITPKKDSYEHQY